MKKSVVILSLCLAFASCSKSQNSSGYSNSNDGGCSAQADYSDSGITLRVKQSLMTDSNLSTRSRFVNVTTNNGIVTLSGTVSNGDDMHIIIKNVKNVAGVRGVNNQMTVAPS